MSELTANLMKMKKTEAIQFTCDTLNNIALKNKIDLPVLDPENYERNIKLHIKSYIHEESYLQDCTVEEVKSILRQERELGKTTPKSKLQKIKKTKRNPNFKKNHINLKGVSKNGI